MGVRGMGGGRRRRPVPGNAWRPGGVHGGI